MASNQRSWDFLFEDDTFVDSVPERFACPICFCPIQREAHLTLCCGHHFCFQCIDRVCKDGKPCPMCKASSVRVFPNKERQRDIKLLKVRCEVDQDSADRRCEWEGELGKLAQHAERQHGVVLDSLLSGTRRSTHNPQSSPQSGGTSNPPPRPPPPTSQPPPLPPWPVRQPRVPPQYSATIPAHPLLRIPLSQSQSSTRQHSNSSSQPPPTPHQRPTARFLSQTSQPFINNYYSRCAAQVQSHIRQTRFSYHCEVSHCLPHSPSSAVKPRCTNVTAPCTPPACPIKKVSSCQSPAQGDEYVHLPGGRILKVYQRKDGSKFYNDHKRRQNIQPHHVVKPAPYTPPTCPVRKVTCQPSPQAREYVHLPEGRTLMVYQRKDGSKFYNDHGRRQNVQPHHVVNTSSAKQTAASTRCTPATSTKTSSQGEYVHLAGGRKLKVYQRKDGSKYYNDRGRRKNL